MSMMKDSQPEAFLDATYFCDFNHPAIKKAAKKLQTKNAVDSAKNVHEFVRERIVLCWDDCQVRASETLAKGYGACWNKALLMVAMLRFLKIPARVARYPLKSDFSKPIFGYAYLFSNNPFYHGTTQVFLNGSWIEIDPTLDKYVFEKCIAPLNVSWSNAWDGVNNHVIYVESIVGDLQYVSDIDLTYKNNFGNRKTPAFVGNWLNKSVWAKTGYRPVRNG